MLRDARRSASASSAVRGCRIWTVDNATCSSDFKLQKYSVHVSQCFHGLSQLFVPAIPQQSGSPLAGYGQHPKAPGSLATGYPMLNMPGSPSTNKSNAPGHGSGSISKVGGVNSTPLGLNSGYYAGYEHNVMASYWQAQNSGQPNNWTGAGKRGRAILEGNESHKLHVEGKAHKQKELMSKGGTVQNLSRNKDAYDAHVKGAKHQKTIATMKKMGQSLPSAEPTLIPPKYPPATTPVIVAAKKKIVGVSGTTFVAGAKLNTTGTEPIDVSVQESQGTESNMNLVGLEFIEEINGVKGKTSYKCKLCDCVMSGSNEKVSHLKGNRHKIQYKIKINPTLKVEVKTPYGSSKKRGRPSDYFNSASSRCPGILYAYAFRVPAAATVFGEQRMIDSEACVYDRAHFENISDKWAEEDKAALLLCWRVLTICSSVLVSTSDGTASSYAAVEKPVDALPVKPCLDALDELKHAKYYQVKCAPLSSMNIVLRIMRDIGNRVKTWTPLSEWAMELLTEKAVSLDF
uniref:DZF domain-containing protein n=1 Tax=Ditylenchus dipsaci TaxID=166011 RepID=A0A915EKI8_9BILA